MGRRPEQTLFQRGHTDGQREKMLSAADRQRHADHGHNGQREKMLSAADCQRHADHSHNGQWEKMLSAADRQTRRSQSQ